MNIISYTVTYPSKILQNLWRGWCSWCIYFPFIQDFAKYLVAILYHFSGALITLFKLLGLPYGIIYRDHSVYGPSQWQTALQCNAVSHWLGPYTEWSLHLSWSVMVLVTVLCLTAPSHNYLNQWLILSIRPQENSCKISMKLVFNTNIPI